MKEHEESHIFAVYYADLNALDKGYTLRDAAIIHRVRNVLRLLPHDRLIVFNREINVECVIDSIDQKKITVTVLSRQQSKQLQPTITCWIPLLKRDAFEDAMYSATELGASHVQLVITEKSQRSWSDVTDLARIERIIHAAAEQSKNFAFPTIARPLALKDAKILAGPAMTAIFFDPDGLRPETVINGMSKKSGDQDIVLFVGPEGDLTVHEKDHIKKMGFVACALTPTVLRAQQALTVGLGLFRSLLSQS